MGRARWIGVGAVGAAATLGALVLAGRGDEPPPRPRSSAGRSSPPVVRASSPSPSPSTTPASALAPVAPAPPSPASTPPSSADPLAPSDDALPVAFDAEARDPGWAAPREREVTDRLHALVDETRAGDRVAQLGTVACRARTCRVPLAGDERALVRVIDAMSDDRGFLHRAAGMHVARAPGGFQVYLRFER